MKHNITVYLILWALPLIFSCFHAASHSDAATACTAQTEEGECFADSIRLDIPGTLLQSCTPAHNTHYYYVEISKTASYTFSASAGVLTLYNSLGKTVPLSGASKQTARLSPDRYYLKLSNASLKGTAAVQVSSAVPKARIPVRKIKLKLRKKTIAVGKKFTLRPSVKPSRATNKNVRFRSSRKRIASVSSKGVVKGKHAGKTTITVTSKSDRSISAKCRLTVRNTRKKSSPSATPVTAVRPGKLPTSEKTSAGTSARHSPSVSTKAKRVTKVRLSSSLLNLRVGKSESLRASVFPADAADKTVTWKSMNPSIASVSGGTVTAKKRGVTTVIATSRANPTCSGCCSISVR